MASYQYNFKVERPTTPLRHDVTERIRAAIAIGRFAAGERMRERDLCEMTGVSRTLIREALRQLESEGVIEVVAHRGPVVAVISHEQARGIYQVREVLEGLAAELFATNANDADRAALRAAFEEVSAAYHGTDPLGWLDAKNRFYACLMRGAGNDALDRSLRMLNARAMLLRGRSMRTPGRPAKSLDEIGQMVDLLIAGKATEARAAAVHHVREAARTALASFRKVARNDDKDS